jgi:Protein kinase domain
VALSRGGYRKGQIVDGWQLKSWLGGGGNGNVWRARHSEHGVAALKILKSRDRDRWQRFRDEVKIMREHRDHPGVLRLIADSVPKSTNRPAWLATPIATPLVKALGGGSELPAVVAAFASYARTLAELASEGASHRDIKPDNLFRLDDAWVLGDFGLVDYPGKRTITAPGRRLGPLFFMAPEMLATPDTADGSLADVYALAKSLWAVATENRYPPGGQIRAELPDQRIGTWFESNPPGSLDLTLLLEQATIAEPDRRPSMAELADRLAEWSKQPRNVDDLAARELQRRAVDRLGERLATSFDADAAEETRRYLSTTIPRFLAEGQAFRQRFRQDAAAQADAQHEAYLADAGVKGVLHLADSPWVGSISDGRDLGRVVLARPPSERPQQLLHLRQVLLGRPLWWMQITALIGLLELIGQDGCEPDATEMTRHQLRRVLLEFPDEPIFAASFRMQRSLIPAVVRLVGLGREAIERHSTALTGVLMASERLLFDVGTENLARIRVDDFMRHQMRADPILAVEKLDATAHEAADLLQRMPIPDSPWFGPLDDPWLESWQEVSPLLHWGLHVLAADSRGDEFLKSDPDLLDAVANAAEGHELLRMPARKLRDRL